MINVMTWFLFLYRNVDADTKGVFMSKKNTKKCMKCGKKNISYRAIKCPQCGNLMRKNTKSIKEGGTMWVNQSSRNIIDKDFFPDELHVDVKNIFPVIIVANMSSGKSTLINALLGRELMPSKNAACTSKMFSILDVDNAVNDKICVVDKSGCELYEEKRESLGELLIKEKIESANDSDEYKEVFVTTDIKNILNTKKNLLIIDTPGPNNSRDEKHESVMKNILRKIHGGLIIYVIDATQSSTNDGKNLLNTLANHIKNNPAMRIVFVLNKIDRIDDEKEDIWDMVVKTKEDLDKSGFNNSEIISISAYAATIFKKVLDKKELSRLEKRSFFECYDLFKPQGFHAMNYSVLSEYSNPIEVREIDGERIFNYELYRALENTGLAYLEKRIQKEQIFSLLNEEVIV
ncbi:dynamin family protein [Eubacterium xylanophilum]|uniref:dynamin family protein n=1 Tax=Eubacterium xylanophilum TaxID=39497 RepID=UPI00047DF161|nr:dynamin family protein [Eubacterium xylanophilum]